jgi:hypothetical protein
MSLCVSGLILMSARAVDEANIKPDIKAMEQRFKVIKERYDPDKRRYVLVLEATMSSNKPCQYEASFQDADDKEVKSVQVEFEDGGRDTTKGQRYTAIVKYPTRKQMEKVTQIVVKKSN